MKKVLRIIIKALLVVELCVLLLIIGLYTFFHLPKIVITKNVTLKTHYMFYACGDCYTQYRVDSVTPNAAFLKGKDIHVVINKNGKYVKLHRIIDKKIVPGVFRISVQALCIIKYKQGIILYE